MEENKDRRNEEVFSKRVRAGKRTYFFDVKTTRSNESYLTITESKRFLKGDEYYYEKHKLFLYKEDFAKFADALMESVEFVKDHDGDDFDMPTFGTAEYEAAESTNNETSELNDGLKWD